MEYIIKEKKVQANEQYDVAVIGGGPAGIGAAIAAARNGAKTVLIEKRAFLGGNITASYVETCNWYLNNTEQKAEGIYAEIESEYRKRFGSSDDIREGSPHRFSSEYLKVFLDEMMKKEGVTVKFHAFVNDVIMEGDEIKCVIIQSKKGPVAIIAKQFVDASGDGDVAFSAGVPFTQGRDGDGKCQPGTVNFRVAGANAEQLSDGYDHLKDVMKQFHEEYRAGKTGLSCYRQDIPFGRLTNGGQISYVNYPCSYDIDPTDVDDLTRGEMECRQYIMEVCQYMRENFEGMQNLELASIAPEIGFRDSRRIEGDYELTKEDIEEDRDFDDTIAVCPRFYDMLTPDKDKLTVGDGGLEGGGYDGHILIFVEGERTYNVPYRTLIPKNVSNLLVSGRCISSTHLAESAIRGIYICMLTGQAAGTAAAISAESGKTTREVDVKELQAALKKGNISIPA